MLSSLKRLLIEYIGLFKMQDPQATFLTCKTHLYLLNMHSTCTSFKDSRHMSVFWNIFWNHRWAGQLCLLHSSAFAPWLHRTMQRLFSLLPRLILGHTLNSEQCYAALRLKLCLKYLIASSPCFHHNFQAYSKWLNFQMCHCEID